MSEWINIDGVMQHIKSKLGISSFDYLLGSEKAIISVIESEPSIDIVRCRECKSWCCKDNKGLDGVCFKGASISQMRRPDFSIGRWRTADDFCSYGERSRR